MSAFQVYFNALLAMLNARNKLNDSTIVHSDAAADMYRLPPMRVHAGIASSDASIDGGVGSPAGLALNSYTMEISQKVCAR